MKKENAGNESTEHIANMLTEALMHKPEVEGVLLLGGFSKGRVADRYSDIDFCVFVNSISSWLPKFEFKVQVKDCVEHFSYITLNVHQLLVEAELASEWNDEKKYAFMRGALAYDKSGIIKNLIEEKTLYSEENTNKLIYCATKIQLYLDINPTIQAKRGHYLLAHHIFNKGIDLLLDTIFLLNKENIPSDKWKLLLVQSLSWVPKNFTETIQKIVIVDKIDALSIETRVELCIPLLNEVCDEIESFFSASILDIYENACSGVLHRQLNRTSFSDQFLKKYQRSMSEQDKRVVEGFINYHLIENEDQLRRVIESNSYDKHIMGSDTCLQLLDNGNA